MQQVELLGYWAALAKVRSKVRLPRLWWWFLRLESIGLPADQLRVHM